MKWGIATLYYGSTNLGGVLQAYAVTRILKKMGQDSEQICYDLSKSNQKMKDINRRSSMERLKKLTPKKAWNHLRKKFEKKFGAKFTSEEAAASQKQRELFGEFRDMIPHSADVYDSGSIGEAADLYDGYVCGSDQIWSPSTLIHDFYTLSFAGTAKPKVAFAASMGKSSLTAREESLLSKKISKIHSISVREKTLENYIKNKLGIENQCILDPTLLLDREDWDEVADDNEALDESPYVLCYFLGNSKWQRRAAVRFANETGMRLIHLPYVIGRKRKSDREFDGQCALPVGPARFLGLIRNASYVFTDSYHAMLFSIIYQKEFVVFNRDGETGKNSGCSRIVDFLRNIGLADRFVTNRRKMIRGDKIDYEQVTMMLDSERKHSLAWLQAAIVPNVGG